MQAVVLAAGMGTRLKNLTNSIPKALVEVERKPLLAYTLSFAQQVKAKQIIVVGGAHYSKVVEYLSGLKLKNLCWVENPIFTHGNLFSLGAARNLICEDFLLLNTDHIYHWKIAQLLIPQCNGIVAFCDQDRKLGADDMKVLLDNKGYLKAISKKLLEYDRGYVGMTYCAQSMLAQYFESFDRVAEQMGKQAVVEMVLDDLVKIGHPPKVGDISGVGWLEIDTPEEHAAAQQVIQNNPENFLSIS